MTSEFLLEAIGHIDDDLVLEAQELPAHQPVSWRRTAALAAAVLLCVGIARIPDLLPLNPTSAGGAVQEADNAAEDFLLDQYREDQESCTQAPATAEKDRCGPFEPKFFTERGIYLPVVAPKVNTLPDGCRELGPLVAAVPGQSTYPSTGTQALVGCPVWESSDGSTLYIRLSDTDWITAVLQP